MIGEILLPESLVGPPIAVFNQHLYYMVDGKRLQIPIDSNEPMHMYQKRVAFILGHFAQSDIVTLLQYSRVYINKLYLGMIYPKAIEDKLKTFVTI